MAWIVEREKVRCTPCEIASLDRLYLLVKLKVRWCGSPVMGEEAGLGGDS